ncbi:olfactory receptor 2G3-like [Tachyglossus aculeatus]|uniref:olfactory receptor 2G3-like n=1 Tax=Tachyglossus aculeatus TaxID=9261 RepID=UPI0018F46732|nr:olfactory receptor 2G3-like [Tachyglossus aculeatus]
MPVMRNDSLGEGFMLMGFSDQPQLEMILFVVVLTSYLLTLVGNTIIIVVSHLDPRLHTPLYFFLSHLSFVDLCLTTSIVPQLLWNLWRPSKAITVVGCAIQLYVSLALGSAECVLLTIMAFDRYAAVCRPLHYKSIMHPRFCHALAAVAWISGLGNSVIQSTITLQIPRCGHQHLTHFICEVPALIKLACVDTKANEIQLFMATLVLLLLPMSLIMLSYGLIARTVLRIKSTQAWRKALGTCGSHLLVVTLFFGMSSIIYIQPNSSFSKTSSKFLTLFYTVVTPTLNPLIYTLRNKDMLGAVKRLLWKDCHWMET